MIPKREIRITVLIQEPLLKMFPMIGPARFAGRPRISLKKNNQRKSGREKSDPVAWVERYGDYLYRYAFIRIRDASAAEDLVQETFLSALHARESFQGRSSEKTWLTAILKHKLVDHLRKQAREKPMEQGDLLDDLADRQFDHKGHWKTGPAKWAVNPLKLFEQKAFWKVLQDCLSEISDRLAQVFTLRELEGMDTEEICKIMDISATNAWVMLHRARGFIRDCLERHWFEKEVTEVR
jgi:RNA polymerase sigma-70 factor (ECF subfamily)